MEVSSGDSVTTYSDGVLMLKEGASYYSGTITSMTGAVVTIDPGAVALSPPTT